MRKRKNPTKCGLLGLLAALALLGVNARAQTTTPGVTVDLLGIGAESLLGGDLTDPENDGEDLAGSATSPTWNWTEITASHEPDFEGAESSFNIFDNKVGGGNDKWCCDDPTFENPVWVAVQFAKQYSLTHFTVTSGNDSPDRDPTNWAIQGSNDGVTYTDIYRFVDTAVPWTERNQVAKFTLPGPAQPYRYFRYIAYETPGSLHQINEIELFGGEGVAADTDKDGMPDEYEIRMGFDPNDPSDAAKDFDNDGVTNLDEYKAGTNPIDVTKPTLVSTATSSSFDTVVIKFSEDLDPATATNVANYVFSPALAVTGASYKAKTVTLTTAKQAAGGTNYTVTVTGVRDLSKNEVPAGTKGSFFSYLLVRDNVMKFTYWGNLDATGTAVDVLVFDPDYPNNPDLITSLSAFNSRDAFPDDSHEQYGATIEGYITPAEAGAYRFFVYSDDASQLFLSTDETEANLALIAEETGCCNYFTEPDSARTSEPVEMVAGKKYFVRMIYKEGGGGDYGQVAWRKEGDPTPAASLLPIPGKFLSSAVDLPAPAEGLIKSQSPAPNAKNVLPNARVTLSHSDGKTPWTSANLTLKINGAAVTPVVTKDANLATVAFTPASFWASGSTNTVTLTHPDPAGNPVNLEWSFVVTGYAGPIVDSVGQVPGLIMGAGKQSADKGGRTGAAGDKGIDFGTKGGASVFIPAAPFLNTAAANDEMTFSIWIKRYDINASSAFWAASPSGGGDLRGWQAHTPWDNNSIYFDTSGCCAADTQRISAGIDTFPTYTGEISWWTNDWHHFVFEKKADRKAIYIDGQLFLEGFGANPLPVDFTSLTLGADTAGGNAMHAQIDDFAVYGTALSAEDAQKLFSGTKPGALGAASKLLAYWDFNGEITVPVNATIAIDATAQGAVSISYTGTLQASDTVDGAYTDVVGAASPYPVTPAGTKKFFRTRK